MIELKVGKKYLVTGGTGFLGKALVKRLTDNGIYNIRVMSRDEGSLIQLKQLFPSIEIYTGDISDKFEVIQAMNNVDAVFHLAASKHVGLAECFVRENIKTNVIGSLNIYEQSIKQDLDFLLSISTDKAAQVSGVYGATKMLMERLGYQYEKLNTNCQYRSVRYGNVLYSTGSVLCKWKDLIIDGKEITITDPSATRFFWTVEQAIDLIIDCLKYSKDNKPYCPTMKAISIGNLLEAMIKKYGNNHKIRIKSIGLQSGENMHEKVMDEGPYSNECEQYTVEEIQDLI